MEIILLNKPQQDVFVAFQPHSQFLQAWDWGEFQKAMGHGIWRLGVFNNDNQLIASAQIIQNKLPLKKSYLYCARGPVFANDLTDDQKTEALKLILSKARDITIATSQTEEIFFRFEPKLEIGNCLPAIRQRRSRWQAGKLEIHQTKPIQPTNTLILDLTQSEAQLLAGMHPKTRYNIKVAERHGLTISEEKNFENVWPLFQQTSKRDGFHLHPKNYYQKMLEVVPWIKLWVAKYQNQNIAAVIISYFGDTATYLHGATDYNQRSLMAPYLLHWQIIKEIKKQIELNSTNIQIIYYDFNGIATALPVTRYAICPDLSATSSRPSGPSRGICSMRPVPSQAEGYAIRAHSWSGITRFKKGFGGKVVNYPGTFDFIYQPVSYRLYKLFRKINLLIRQYG